MPVPHCIKDTDGWEIIPEIIVEKNDIIINKPTFGSIALMRILEQINERENGNVEFEFIGVCTDICVVSNVLMTRASFPNHIITVDANCCAGVTEETHTSALNTMKSCQITII